MNFVTLLSLLLVSEITSMNPESSYANRPFENYTSNEKRILRRLTKSIEVAKTVALKLTVSNFITKLSEKLKLFDTPEKLCEPEEITSNPLEYVPTVQSQKQCQNNCSKKNNKYVKFFNKSIFLLKEKLFRSKHTDYIIFLEPLEVGKCKKEDEKIFKCDCDTNYLIHMNTKFEDLLNRLGDESICEEKTHLIVIAYLLKFHPHSAIVYLIWLFNYYDIVVKSSGTTNTRSATISLSDEELDDPFDTEAQYGGGKRALTIHEIENKGVLRNLDDQLFKLLFSFVDEGDNDKINKFYDTFCNNREIYLWIGGVDTALMVIYLTFWV